MKNHAMPEFPSRKFPAHGILSIIGQPAIIFDTICTKDRQPWLACEAVHEQLRKIWIQSDAWKVGRYVLMPDHIHLFAVETGKTIYDENWLRYWKSQFTKNARSEWPQMAIASLGPATPQ